MSDDEDDFDEALIRDEDLERHEDAAARAAQQSVDRDERELVAAWLAGDRQAGNALVQRYARRITRFYQAKVHDTDRVEQLLSEFYEQLVKAPKQIHTTVRAYVFGVARFTLIRHFRTRNRNREDPTDATLVELDVAAETPFGANQRVETRLLLRAMRRIRLEHAMALEMHEFEGMSGREIADVLGVPEGTVRSYLRKGLVELHRALLAIERDPKVLLATGGTYTWLAGLLRHIEALREKSGKSSDPETE